MQVDAQPLLNREEMERRRLDAAQDLLDGLSQAGVARKYGVSRTTASRWGRALGSGLETLKKRKATGRPSRLTADQLTGISRIYADPPSAHGFEAARWTSARLAEAIYRVYAIRYDPDHVGRLMHRLGLRPRRQRRAP